MKPAPLITREELAARWRISPFTIRRHEKIGILKPVRFSRNVVRYLQSDIEAVEARSNYTPKP